MEEIIVGRAEAFRLGTTSEEVRAATLARVQSVHAEVREVKAELQAQMARAAAGRARRGPRGRGRGRAGRGRRGARGRGMGGRRHPEHPEFGGRRVVVPSEVFSVPGLMYVGVLARFGRFRSTQRV